MSDIKGKQSLAEMQAAVEKAKKSIAHIDKTTSDLAQAQLKNLPDQVDKHTAALQGHFKKFNQANGKIQQLASKMLKK